MARQSTSRAQLSRRGFIGLASTLAPALWLERVWAGPVEGQGLARNPARLSVFDREHLPRLRIPTFTTNRAKVPIVVEMSHPMTRDHFITRVEVVNAGDDVAAKGTFHLTPANGRVHVGFQARMDPGTSEVVVTAECNRHGRFSSAQTILVDEGGGGCSGGDPAVRRTVGHDVRPPTIRIAELVDSGQLRQGEIIHAQVKLRHPNRRPPPPGAGEPVPGFQPLFLERLEAYYGDEPAGRFDMTAALSEDPFITFALAVRRQQDLRVVLVNNRGERLEARHEIRSGPGGSGPTGGKTPSLTKSFSR